MKHAIAPGATLAALAALTCHAGWAAPTPREFQQAVIALHEQQIALQAVRTQKVERPYEGVAAKGSRYVETSYFEAASGRLLSRVRRDATRPFAVHVIEVNVHDDTGRVVRDYGSIAMPWSPQQPSISIINVHRHHEGLHSFRQFNLAGAVTYESCAGTLDGRRVSVSLDATDITPQVTASADYQACFDGVAKDAAKYLMPF